MIIHQNLFLLCNCKVVPNKYSPLNSSLSLSISLSPPLPVFLSSVDNSSTLYLYEISLVCLVFIIPYVREIMKYCHSVPSLFQLTLHPPASSMLLQVTGFHSFLLLNCNLFCMYTPPFLYPFIP